MKFVSKSFAIVAFGAAAVSLPSVSAAETTTTESAADEKAKKPKKITDRRHPDYMRCRSEPIIGSLARKKRICMTNAEWAAHNQEGSRRSKEFVEDMQVGQNPSN